ncbi:MAG TPA: hypothetical protein VI457_14820 [Methylococcaceae bacterium]|nr:hypothetical protein [Methylococcaceae bacterium]
MSTLFDQRYKLPQLSTHCRNTGAGRAGTLALAALLLAGAPLSFAAIEGGNGARRWISGSLVNLRAQPLANAKVVKRLALNAEVDLLATLPDGKFCEIAQLEKGETKARGFAACQYLGSAPVSMENTSRQYLEDGGPNPNYNPQRAFWLTPSYQALVAYGEYLEETQLSPEERNDLAHPRPPVEEFERMKAHLAKGIYGPTPKPYPDWAALKRSAREWEAKRKAVLAAKGSENASDAHDELQSAASPFQHVQAVLGTHDIDTVKTLSLVNAISLPAVEVSLFRRMDELAPPGERAEQVSGRFGIIHTVRTGGREAGSGAEKWPVSGSWDFAQVSQSLTQPVTRNVLFRDGSIATNETHLKHSFIEWSESEGPMCEGYSDGYAYGDSDRQIWIGYGLGEEAYRESLKRNGENSLMYFYTRDPLPEQEAIVTKSRQKLDRDATGFVAATTFYFDLNSDDIPDIAVWEGTGRAQGHLDGEPQTDDAYQRLFFANMAGHWRVLGSDAFGYGCGC